VSTYARRGNGMQLTNVRMLDYKGRGRKPLRTLREMADEFGITPKALARYIYLRGGPQSHMKTKRLDTSNTWYEPGELRTWWAKQPESHR